MSVIDVQNNLGIPKYKQIIQSIENALLDGVLNKGDKLPSVNSIRDQFDLSRDTVFMAFKELKSRGIIDSVAGKGYYIKSADVNVSQKVFLLFDELNAFKEDLYTSFLDHLEPHVKVDIFFHHFNEHVFERLIEDGMGAYNYYVIMPANIKQSAKIISRLPVDKTYILDQMPPELRSYPSVFQNFEKDIYESLMKAQPFFEKYEKLVLLFPQTKQPLGMLKGFQNFRKTASIETEVIESLRDRTVRNGEVYLILEDNDLIWFIKHIKEKELELGKDVGLISYNDTLLKEVVEGGITTISTDFKLMGERLAKMISHNEQLQIENPNKLTIRNSL